MPYLALSLGFAFIICFVWWRDHCKVFGKGDKGFVENTLDQKKADQMASTLRVHRFILYVLTAFWFGLFLFAAFEQDEIRTTELVILILALATYITASRLDARIKIILLADRLRPPDPAEPINKDDD